MTSTLTCGDVKLLAAIFGRDAIKLGERLGIPIREKIPYYHPCPRCRKIMIRRPSLLCRKCLDASKWIKIACSECGKLFPRYAHEIVHNTSKKSYQHFFCDRHCFGKWLAKNYGFPVHPKHRYKVKRKHDYNLVWQTHLDTGMGSRCLSKLLAIPESSIGHILRQKRKELGIIKRNGKYER